jgi:hypothetical protein
MKKLSKNQGFKTPPRRIIFGGSFKLLPKITFALCPLPFALCPLPFALCPLPFALCPLPFALCPFDLNYSDFCF